MLDTLLVAKLYYIIVKNMLGSIPLDERSMNYPMRFIEDVSITIWTLFPSNGIDCSVVTLSVSFFEIIVVGVGVRAVVFIVRVTVDKVGVRFARYSFCFYIKRVILLRLIFATISSKLCRQIDPNWSWVENFYHQLRCLRCFLLLENGVILVSAQWLQYYWCVHHCEGY